MSTDEVTVFLGGMTALEVAELRSSLVEAGADPALMLNVAKESSDVTGSRKGEPATMLVIIAVSQLALTGMSIYLSKGKKRVRSEEMLIFQTSNGEKIEYRLSKDVETQEAIHADLMKQIRQFKPPTFPSDDR